MKVLRLLAVTVLGFLAAFSYADDQDVIKTAKEAAEGLKAIGKLLQQLASGKLTRQQELDASAFLSLPLLAEMVPSEEKERVEEAYKSGMEASLALREVGKELRRITKAIIQERDPDTKEELTDRQQELLERYRKLANQVYVKLLLMSGLDEEQAKQYVSDDVVFRATTAFLPIYEALRKAD